MQWKGFDKFKEDSGKCRSFKSFYSHDMNCSGNYYITVPLLMTDNSQRSILFIIVVK